MDYVIIKLYNIDLQEGLVVFFMNILSLFKRINNKTTTKSDFTFNEFIIIDNKRDKLDLLMGFSSNNDNSIFKNLVDLKHIYSIGCTGSGCSNTIRQFIKSLITNNSRDAVQLLFIDCTKTEFIEFNNHPLLAKPIATTDSEIKDLLTYLHNEYLVRKENKDKIYPSLVLFDSGLANTLLFCDNVYNILKDLVSDGHHYGIHLICDSGFVMPNEVDLVELFPTKIIHSMNGDRLHKQITDNYTVENKNIKGQYYLFTDNINPEIIQAYYIPYKIELDYT